MSQGGNRARIHTYRTPKKVFLANQAQGPSPAWKGDRGGSGAPPTHRESGSRILISRLPPDVTLQELSVGDTRLVNTSGLTYLRHEGSIQQDYWTDEGGDVILQRQGASEGDGHGGFPTRR